MERLFLTGFMGSGKSRIGRELANRLDLPFIDTDHEIEVQTNKTIVEIFAGRGEFSFRRLEQQTIRMAVKQTKKAVIALGGGALIDAGNQQTVLQNGLLIWIRSSPAEIWKRIKHSTKRPLLPGATEGWTRRQYLRYISGLLAERSPGYEKAHIIFDRDKWEAGAAADQLMILLSQFKERGKVNE